MDNNRLEKSKRIGLKLRPKKTFLKDDRFWTKTISLNVQGVANSCTHSLTILYFYILL